MSTASGSGLWAALLCASLLWLLFMCLRRFFCFREVSASQTDFFRMLDMKIESVSPVLSCPGPARLRLALALDILYPLAYIMMSSRLDTRQPHLFSDYRASSLCSFR